MVFRFVQDSIRRAPKRKAMLIAAIALGSAVATSMLGVMLSIGDKINRELRTAGANISIAPQSGGAGAFAAASGYIDEANLPKIHKIFWGNNITGFAPSLSARDGATQIQGTWFDNLYTGPNGKALTTGVRAVNPAWQIEQGKWPRDTRAECAVGFGVFRRTGWKVGSDITLLGQTCKVTGILSTGEDADDRVLMPLAMVQQATSRIGKLDHIDVAALTKPEDAFAHKDPKTMTPEEYERWSCTNYVTSIAAQLETALPGTVARPVRRVADSEGKVLSRIGGLMFLITLAALLSAGLTAWSLTATTMMERRGEIAIMQAIGGARWLVALLLAIEIALIGLAGGIAGAGIGVFLARAVGESVFHDPITISPALPFLIMFAAMLVALAGAAQPLRRALHTEPAVILRGGV